MTTKTTGVSASKVVPHPSIHAALAAAQMELSDIVADMENSHFRNKYTSLGAVLSAVRPILSKHGWAIYTTISPAYEKVVDQGPPVTDKEVINGHYITGVVSFDGDESIESTVYCPKQQSVHAFASFHTYARRWLTQGLCGVGVDLDDDGNVAVDTDRGSAELKRRVANR